MRKHGLEYLSLRERPELREQASEWFHSKWGVALVDTGSKMDEVIFEEFKGTGNSEIQLNRALSNKRIFPAIDLVQSSTRRDDLLLDETTLNRMWIMRKFIAEMNPMEAMNTVRDRLVTTRTNEEFLLSMNG